jgi:type IV pilus assembly protein PilY1
MSPHPACADGRFHFRLKCVVKRRAWRQLVVCWTALTLLLTPVAPFSAAAAVPANAPQVLLAITNSSSMDGDTSGAIYVGSGLTGETFFNATSSPANYTIPADFTPPLQTNSDGVTAPYTRACVTNATYQCDNSASRMNMAKAAVKSVLAEYGNVINFGLYDYATTGQLSVYDTWVYYMSPTTGGGQFSFTGTASTNTVANPCYHYSSQPNGTAKTDCGWIDNHYSASIDSQPYLVVSDTSDNPVINDVLYVPSTLNYPDAFVVYSGPNPATPYTAPNSLTTYKAGTVSIGYGAWTVNNNTLVGWGTSPTNAGYVAYTSEVFYALRGFGYNALPSSTTGNTVVSIGTAASDAAFTTALNPETNNAGTAEIKSAAAQSPIAGLMQGALSYLNGVTKASCQPQYVVLLTDGLPTRDLAGKNWPPLGTASATGYSVTAGYNSDGSLNTATTNDQAMIDAITKITALRTAGIKTYVVGLGAGVNASANTAAVKALTAMAIAGGTTTFYPASSQSALTTAFSGIVNQIYSASSIAAPIAPLSVASGNAFEYTLTSQPAPTSGSAQAFAASAAGVVATTPSWDAAMLMTSGGRSSSLYSTATNGTVTLLSALDAAAFSLTASTCIPNTSTVVSFTVNPSYSAISGCSYLAGRASGSFLGTFSGQNAGLYVGPPANSALVGDSSYVSYAANTHGRVGMLMFSNNDGFLYAVNGATGALLWAWTPRSLVALLQSYASFQSNQYMNGGFTVVDAKDGSGNWGSYVVGSTRGGAEHYSLKLNSSGLPTTVVYDSSVSGGSASGDAAVTTTGSKPLHQPPQIAYIGGSSYAIHVVNTTVGTTTTSTLYEVNVATGTSTSAALSPVVSSVLSYADQTGALWFGSAAGGVYQMGITGNAATDAALALQVGSTVNPASPSTATTNILYVGYTELKGVPYVYAINAGQITVYTVGTSGWTPLWATTPSSGYRYSAGSYATASSINTLQTSAVVSDAALVANGALIVPQYVATSSGCGAGSGYYGFFDLIGGTFPTTTLTYQSTALTNDLLVGSGPAFTPSVVVTSSGASLNPGTSSMLTPGSTLNMSGLSGPAVVAWRQL